jgi:hypothetical protein
MSDDYDDRSRRGRREHSNYRKNYNHPDNYDQHDQYSDSRPAQGYRRLYKPSQTQQTYDRDSGYSGDRRYKKLDRRDIIQGRPKRNDFDYWDTPTIDYGAGEYEPDYFDEYDYDDYDSDTYYEPGHVHQPGQEQEHKYEHDRWVRQRYGMGSGLPEYWTDRSGDYETSMDAQYPEQGDWDDQEPIAAYYPDGYYVEAPDYYRDRYMPEDDTLNRLYMKMFRNIDYNLKVPIMQFIATGALFFIFVLNYSLNIEYVIALSNFSPWVAVQPPMVAAILGALFGIFLYLFPNLDPDIKRTVIIGTIILLIFFFAGPALLAWLAESDVTIVGKAFAESIEQFLKLAAVLVYWAPMFLGIYGIWTRNSFYIGASAMFLFLIIIILDVYLLSQEEPITKLRENWLQYVIFSIVLFCYMEMSDSAITFANYTSVRDKDAIDPGYYEHLDKILEKYFVYFILLNIFIIILTWITMSFSDVLETFGSSQVAESLELGSIYGTIIALIVIAIIILFIGLFIRYEVAMKQIYNKIFKPNFDSRRKRRFYERSDWTRNRESVQTNPTNPTNPRNRPTRIRR